MLQVLAAVAAAAAPTKPHIFFLMADDLGWANVGWHNPEHALTPRMDALVKGGVELDRHYVFWFCAPTRASFHSGRYPMHVNEAFDDCTPEGTAPHNMTLFPAKLKQAGYATHQIGKWGVGQGSRRSIPVARGYDTSFGYLGSAEDHHKHTNGGCGSRVCGGNVDLWDSDKPAAKSFDGKYSAEMYNERAVQIVNAHDQSTPLFLYLAAQNCHAPDQPDRWLSVYPAPYTTDYANYNGMAAALDSMAGNVTDAMKAKGMWEHTLMVFSSDNGGPAAHSVSGHHANNWPHRGGKHTAWEGGHRVSAFAAGGWIPQAMSGKQLDGYIHVSDWYVTFSKLAGADPTDDAPGMPAVDGIDQWPYLSGSAPESARTELPLSSLPGACQGGCEGGGAALIVGDWKLVRGKLLYCFIQGPVYPNASTVQNKDTEPTCNCPDTGCLFNVRTDPGEYHDVAAANPDIAARLLKRAQELDATEINTVKGAGWRGKANATAACEVMTANGGVWGPYMP